MKKLFWILPLLVGCATPTYSSVPVQNPSPLLVNIARGTNGHISWACELTDLNDALAWVQCDFVNDGIVKDTLQDCISVAFWDESTNKMVAQSRKICSGPLQPGATSTRFVAFFENRKKLDPCGKNLDKCFMLADDYIEGQ